MDAVTLSHLRKPRTYPAVSVIVPTHRHLPGNRQDPIRLRNLLAEARDRLDRDDRVAADTADEIMAVLHEAAGRVDLNHAEEGLILFAAPDGEHHAYKVAQPVDERVVLDTTFATRDLVHAYTRIRRYWLLVLSDHVSRLWDGQAEELTEVEGRGFPIANQVPEGAYDSSGRQSPKRSAPVVDEHLRKYFRGVMSALESVLNRDRRPVIVAGVTRHQAFFDEIAGPLVTVAGRIDGAYDGAPASALAELAAPVLSAYEDLQEVAVLAELEAARNARRYAAGLDEVTRLAQEGRGAHLVVERGYYAPAVRTNGGFVQVDGHVGELKGGDVVDDVVDNVVETVMEYGGEVTFVSDGFLVDHDRIALVTRF